jgi:hypothetical protein
MISEPTVFIIGAGASGEYGFPLGQALVKRILVHMAGTNTTIHRAMNLAGLDPRGLELFRDRLRGADAESIDTFLEGNEEPFVRVGKAAIAYAILEAEERCRREGLLIEASPSDHWLRYIWSTLRSGCTASTLDHNRATFISYNYDRVLESYLQQVIANSFNLDSAGAAQLRERAVPIIHLHGQIATAAFGQFDEPSIVVSLAQFASGIRVVHDSVPEGDPAFTSAQTAIRNARRICFLGFGYHPVNIRRLAIHESAPSNTEIYGSAFAMGPAEIKRAKDLVGREIMGMPQTAKCERFLRDAVFLA